MTPTGSRLRTAAIIGALAVAFGAFGAHGLERIIDDAHRLDVWKTASHYHLTHAIVLLALALAVPDPKQARGAWWSFIGGIGIFSGTLYVLSLTGIRWLGAITPIGGVLLIVGWLLLAMIAGRRPGAAN